MNSISHIISEKLSITDYIDNLFYVNDPSDDNRIEYYKMQARAVSADFIYCIYSELENQPIPFIYIYDRRDFSTDSSELSKINKQIWTIGEIVLAVVIYNDGITIIDTRKPLDDNDEANIILKKVHQIDEKLRTIYFEGRILEEEEDYASVSPYQKLLELIEKSILNKKDKIGCSPELLRKLIVKFILIKYIEEQTDDNGISVFKGYFSQFITNPDQNEVRFCDVLEKGDVVELFNKLNSTFNGGLFSIASAKEEDEIRNANFEPIAIALGGTTEIDRQKTIWRLYDFKLLPIEFISRLYEKFVVSDEGKQKEYGAYYTPPHLARLLIDELLPFDKTIDFDNFKLLDPSCGSGIFLVLAYKRLITLWMLANKKQKIEGENDIKSIKNILSNCIYGVDINPDSISITATSLQIELTSHIQPKEILDSLRFDDLLKRGNLKECGFFKWYKTETNRYDVVVGNPPFNIGRKTNKENIISGKDDDYINEVYIDYNGKHKTFPDKNPALSFIYFSLEKLLTKQGDLFMIMPASSLLYMPTALNYRKTLLSKWNVKKIYDFTPLIDHLWGKTKVATIAININKEIPNDTTIEHIIVRNTTINKNGTLRFQVDKYDKFKIPIDIAIKKDFIWKTNLFGGGYLGLFIEKYKNKYSTIEDFCKENEWIANVGYQRDSSAKNKINLNGKIVLVSELFQNDFISDAAVKLVEEDDYVRIVKKDILYEPQNILMRLSINYDIPIAFNNRKIFFPKGILGIKGNDSSRMQKFVSIFIQNRELYKLLIKATSSKIFIQQGGEYTIDAQDILRLPICTDDKGNPIAFEAMGHIEKAALEDAELMAQCLNKTKKKLLFNPIKKEELDQYSEVLCETLNYVYERGDYKFRLVRKIISDNYVWITFIHAKESLCIEEQTSIEENELLNSILKEDISKNGLSINRIITYYGENNRVSFIKPRNLKYWTRSIGYRDAENVKAELFKNGY